MPDFAFRDGDALPDNKDRVTNAAEQMQYRSLDHWSTALHNIPDYESRFPGEDPDASISWTEKKGPGKRYR